MSITQNVFSDYTSEDKMKPYENLQVQTTVPTQHVNFSSAPFIVPTNYTPNELQLKSETQ